MKKKQSVLSRNGNRWFDVRDFCSMYGQDHEAWRFRSDTDAERQDIVGVFAQDGSVKLFLGEETSSVFSCSSFMFRKIGLKLADVLAGTGEVYEMWSTRWVLQSVAGKHGKHVYRCVPLRPIGYLYFSFWALEKRCAPAPVISLSTAKRVDELELDPLEMALDFPSTQNPAPRVSRRVSGASDCT